jgi:hypothetical protein
MQGKRKAGEGKQIRWEIQYRRKKKKTANVLLRRTLRINDALNEIDKKN